jgi:hypothetical protein
MKAILLAAVITTFGANPGGAAIGPPDERYHVRLPDLPPAVARDTIGVLDLLVRDTRQSGAAISIYNDMGADFTMAGSLRVSDVLPVSAVSFEASKALRFPIVRIDGEYRRIVYHAARDMRAWIKFTDHADARLDMRSFDNHSEKALLYLETHFMTDDAPTSESWRPDIFYLTAGESRKILQTPDVNAVFEVVTPATKTYKGDMRRGGYYHNALRFARIRQGFAEVVVDRYPQAEPISLGWIRLKEDGYRSFQDYFPQGPQYGLYGGSSIPCIQLFSPGQEHEKRKVYVLPDPNAPYREFDRDTLQESVREDIEDEGVKVFILGMRNGFILAGKIAGIDEPTPADDICADEGCGSPCELAVPVGWIRVRDEQDRLTIWPTIPYCWSCTC